MRAEELWHAMQVHHHLYTLTEYVINNWPSTKAQVKEDIQLYLPFKDVIAVLHCKVMICRRIVVPASLQES